jgi:hypothetical protein
MGNREPYRERLVVFGVSRVFIYLTKKTCQSVFSAPSISPLELVVKPIYALALLFVFIFSSPVSATDPLKVHDAAFGPEINGLRLGAKMTWQKMISIQRVTREGPFSIPSPFGMIIADNESDVDRQDSSPTKKGKWILVNFFGGDGATIMNGGGGMLEITPKEGFMDDFFKIWKENGLNYASTPNITLRDERVIKYSVSRKSLPMETSATPEFAKWLSQAYSLGVMEQKGEAYEVSNLSEGWLIVATDGNVTVSAAPIKDKTDK